MAEMEQLTEAAVLGEGALLAFRGESSVLD